LISGLSHGVVVVEATAKSGSLITARLALDQGREVFAVPGSPLDPRAKGPNGLIRDGATLVESAADVLRQLQNLGRDIVREPPADHFAERPPAPADESDVGRARVEVLGRLGPTPVTVDELLRQCQVSAPVLATVLLELELAGRLERSAGARVALVGEPVINE
jgi:DNA processing protein